MNATMKDLALGIAASIIAALILMGGSQLLDRFSTAQQYLDVTTSIEAYGSLSINRISVTNSAKYAIDPLQFKGLSTGTLLRGVATTDGRSSSLSPGIGQYLWTGVLGSKETVQFLLVIDGGEIDQDHDKQFSGEYLYLGQRGLPEKKRIKLRSAAETQLARYRVVAKSAGLVVVLITVGTIVIRVRRRRKARPT